MTSWGNEFRGASRSFALVVTLGLLTAFVVYAALSGMSQQYAAGPNLGGVYYYVDGEYHFLLYAFNTAGGPLPEGTASVALVFVGANGTTVHTATAAGHPGASGRVSLTLAGPDLPGYVWLNYSESSEVEQGSGIGIVSPIAPGPPGTIQPVGFAFGIVNLGTLAPVPAVLAIAAGPNGTAPVGFTIDYSYTCYPNGSSCPGFRAINGTVTTLSRTFGVYPVALPPNAPKTDWLTLSLHAPNGAVVASQQWRPQSTPAASLSYPTPSVAFLAWGAYPFQLLWPLVGIIVGFVVHGRSRTGNFVDGTLVRPTTRVEILTSRFGAAAAWTALPAFAAMATIQGAVAYWFHLAYPLVPLVFEGLAVWAAMLAWVGLTILISHLSRSTTVVVALPVVLFVFFAIGWPLVVAPVLSPLGLWWPPVFYETLANPVQLPSLMAYASAPSVAGAMLGHWYFGWVGILDVGVACLTWTLIPLAGALVVWTWRD